MPRASLLRSASFSFAALAGACASAPEPSPEPPQVIIAAPPPTALVAASENSPDEEEPAEVAAAPQTVPEPPPAETPAPSPWLAGPAKPKPGGVDLQGVQVVVADPITFDTGKPTLKAASDPAMDQLAAFLKGRSEITILRIEGHTDSLGSADANLTLAGTRTMTIAKSLVARGIDCRRLLAVGFGETKPIADNKTADGRAANRRMAFVVAALKGKPVNRMPVDGGGWVAGDPCR